METWQLKGKILSLTRSQYLLIQLFWKCNSLRNFARVYLIPVELIVLIAWPIILLYVSL